MLALQSIVSRNADPLTPAVISVTSFRTESDASNIIPEHVELRGTARTPRPGDPGPDRGADARAVVEATAAAYGARADFAYRRGYPVTVNAAAEADFAARVAAEVVGDARVDTGGAAGDGRRGLLLHAERPARRLHPVGNGDTANLHHPAYDFNDEVIPVGCSYWARLVETAMPAS